MAQQLAEAVDVDIQVKIDAALMAIREFACGYTWMYNRAVEAYRFCTGLGFPVKEYVELLFMQEIDSPDPDYLKRKMYRLRLKGAKMFGRGPVGDYQGE